MSEGCLIVIPHSILHRAQDSQYGYAVFFLTTNEPTMLTTRTKTMNTNDQTASISMKSWMRSLIPMKSRRNETPGFKSQNLSATPAKRKNIARKPRMAKMLEKNTT